MLRKEGQQQLVTKSPTKIMQKYIKFTPKKSINIAQHFQKLLASIFTSVVPVIIMNFQIKKQSNKNMFQKFNWNKFSYIRRPIQLNTSIFVMKRLLDSIDEQLYIQTNQYRKGALIGFISFLINRPLDQIDIIQKFILNNQNKKINKIQAIKIIMNRDGYLGFYKYQNILGPINFTIYRSIFFGVYSKLCKKYRQQNNIYANLLFFPYLASLVASISTFIPQKVRLYIMNQQKNRDMSLVNRKKAVPQLQPIAGKVINFLADSQILPSRQNIIYLLINSLKNWILFSSYLIGQHLIQNQHQKRTQ